MKKKMGIISILMLVIIVMTGCAPSPQAEYGNYMKEQASNKMNAGSFEMSIADLELSPDAKAEANNTAVNMVMSQIKNIKLKGNYQADAKNQNIVKVDMNFNMMGLEIPFEVYTNMGEEPEAYMSMDFMSSIADIAQMFGGAEVPDLSGLDAFAGKYVDLIELQDTAEVTEKQTLMDKKAMKVAEEYSAAYRKEAFAYINSLDKKSFTKKDDTLSHTFTKKEILGLLDLTQKVAKSDKKFKEYVADEDVDFAELFEQFKDITVATQINTKKNTGKYTVKMVPTDAEEAGLKSLKLVFKVKNSSNKETVKMPKKSSILSKEEMEELAGSIGGATGGLTGDIVSDEEFEALKAELVKQKENIDEETLNNLLETYSTVLTEEQQKELIDALK